MNYEKIFHAAHFFACGITWSVSIDAYDKNYREVCFMCNNNGLCGCFGGGNWWWIIILILLFCNCGCGNTNNGCNTGWGNGCERDNCGCC